MLTKFTYNIVFLNSHFGYLANSVDPDLQKPTNHDLHCFSSSYLMLHNYEIGKCETCIHLLKIASDGNFNLLFEKLLAFSKR